MVKKTFVLEEHINKQNRGIDLHNEYTHIRGYHGCRPLSVDEYYMQGIKPIEKSFAKKEAMARLCNKNITEKMVIDSFEKAWEKLHFPRNSVWMTFTESELLDNCGHYVIYGSEFICGIAAVLKCQTQLKKIGIPTIFCCDIPLNNVPDCYLEEINQMLIDRNSAGGFRVVDKILPEEIIDCIHPKKIHDPLTWTTYIYRG